MSGIVGDVELAAQHPLLHLAHRRDVTRAPHPVVWNASVELVEARRGIADQVVALTFDDGPAPWTEPIAEALERHGGRGTFFAIGEEVDDRRGAPHRPPAARRRATRSGTTPGRTQTSSRPTTPPSRTRCAARRPCSPRSPGARSTAGARRSSARTSACARRWATSRAERCGSPRCPATGTSPPRRPPRRVLADLEPGDIVVLHDGRPANEPPELSWPTREATVGAVGLILEEMAAARPPLGHGLRAAGELLTLSPARSPARRARPSRRASAPASATPRRRGRATRPCRPASGRGSG